MAQLACQLAGVAKDATVEEQIRLHRSLLRQFGRGAGAAMWDEVVRPFVVRLAEAGHVKAARGALADARSALRVGLGSQLDGEMRGLEAFLTKAASAEKPAGPAHAP